MLNDTKYVQDPRMDYQIQYDTHCEVCGSNQHSTTRHIRDVEEEILIHRMQEAN